MRRGPCAPVEVRHVVLQCIPEFSVIARTVRFHHERWDGSGFPCGLSGETISFAARILAIANAFDAMTSDRPYRPALPWQTALAGIGQGAGSQFDTVLAAIFTDAICREVWDNAVSIATDSVRQCNLLERGTRP